MTKIKSKYFTLDELTYSATADIYDIDNNPNDEIIENLIELMNVLDTIRELWGKPIRVLSGYRCKELNSAVGGSKTSAHLNGFAADIKPFNNDMESFIQVVKEWAKTNDFDQILIENNSLGGHWLHFGYKSPKGEFRYQIKKLKV